MTLTDVPLSILYTFIL